MSTYALIVNGSTYDFESNLSLYVQSSSGIGMAPQDDITFPYAAGDGSYYQRTVVRERVITLTCTWQKNAIAALHSARKVLIALVNRDANNSAVFTLRYYQAGATPIDILVRYHAGLEGDINVQNLAAPFQISFLAVDPFWRGTAANTVSMNTTASLSNATYLLQQAASVWSGVNNGPTVAATVQAVCENSAGTLWIGTAANLYMRTSAGAWTTYACVGGGVKSLVLAANGLDVYAGGDFTNLGGAGIGKCVKVTTGGVVSNPSSTTISVTVNGLLLTPNYLYAATADTTASQSIYRCVLGAAWATGLTANATKNATCIMGGSLGTSDFLYYAAQPNAGGDPHTYAWASPSVFADYGAVSAGGSINAIYYGALGGVVIGGSFTTINGVAAANIALLSGAWSALGSGLNNTVAALAWDGTNLYAAGTFTNTGYSYLAKWASSSWGSAGIAPAVAGQALVYSATTGHLTAGFVSPGTAPASAGSPGTTSIANTSDRVAFPVITITASGATTLQSIKNSFTGDPLLFNQVMQAGEVIVITCTPGARSVVSSTGAQVFMLPGSSFSTFGISPGTQNYTVQFSDGSKATVSLSYYYTYQSADSVAA